MNYNLSWVIDKTEQNEPLKYIFFWGHSKSGEEEVGKFIFSQWFPSPFVVDGITYPTAEHWMMAQKALLFDDAEIFNKIIAASKPGEVKELGRKIKSFEEKKWNDNKYRIVIEGNAHKFRQNEKLRDYLINTGDRVIVEASPVDKIWGIGLAQDAKNIEDPRTWKGENLLGFALMEVRDNLK